MKIEKSNEYDVGFATIPDGEYLFEIGDDIGFITGKETKETTNTFRIPLRVAEGEYEGAQPTSFFCPMDKKFGRIRLAQVLYLTGLAEKISKEKNLPSIDSDEGWPDDLFDPESKRFSKFMGMVANRLPGYQIKGELKTAKGKDGKEYQNIVKIAQVKTKTTPVTSDTVDEEDEW